MPGAWPSIAGAAWPHGTRYLVGNWPLPACAMGAFLGSRRGMGGRRWQLLGRQGPGFLLSADFVRIRLRMPSFFLCEKGTLAPPLPAIWGTGGRSGCKQGCRTQASCQPVTHLLPLSFLRAVDRVLRTAASGGLLGRVSAIVHMVLTEGRHVREKGLLSIRQSGHRLTTW